MKYAYGDHFRQEKILNESGLDLTSIRLVILTDEDNISEEIVNMGDGTKLNRIISRKSLANFILDCLEKNKYIQQKPGISA